MQLLRMKKKEIWGIKNVQYQQIKGILCMDLHGELREIEGNNYMVMAHYCLGKKSCGWFLTGKPMYQRQRRISLVYYHS